MLHFFHLLLEDIYFKSLCILNSFLAYIHLVNFLIFNLKLLGNTQELGTDNNYNYRKDNNQAIVVEEGSSKDNIIRDNKVVN